MGVFRGGGGGSLVSIDLYFNDWELKKVKNFLLVIQGKRIIPNQKNMLLMKEVKDDHFWVKHFYMS